jgi:hypothetical protein
MAKSRAELRELVGKLLAEYAKFQRRPRICPKAISSICPKRNWRSSSLNFSAIWQPKQTTLIQRHRDLCSIERRLAR